MEVVARSPASRDYACSSNRPAAAREGMRLVVPVRRSPYGASRSFRSAADAETRAAHDVAGGARGRKSPPSLPSAVPVRTTSVPGAAVRRGADTSGCASARAKLAHVAWHSAHSAGWMRAHPPLVRLSTCAVTTPRAADSRSIVASANAATPGSAICTADRTRISQRDAMERRVTNSCAVMSRRARQAPKYPCSIRGSGAMGQQLALHRGGACNAALRFAMRRPLLHLPAGAVGVHSC